MHGNVIRFGVTGVASLVLAGSIASSLAAVGCGLQCDRNPNQPPVPYKAGVTAHAGEATGFYQTSGYPGPYLPFPPGRTYRLYHGLGACPANVIADFAFDTSPASGTSNGPDKSGTVVAAGNQFTIERVTPDFVDVRNDTCSDVSLRVIASEPDFTGTACTPLGEDAGNARGPASTPNTSTLDAATP